MKKTIVKILYWVKDIVSKKLRYENTDLPYYITIFIALVLFSVGLNMFLSLAENLAENELKPYDDRVSDIVFSYRSDMLTAFFQTITHLGDRIAYIILAVVLTAFFWIRFRNWQFSLQMIVVLILSSVSNLVLKQFFNRSRPSLEHLVAVNSLSFPSGHSMSAMAFYGFLIYIVLRFHPPLWLRVALITLLSILILSIGMSRIYLGVHYPSDVAAGFVGGLIWIALCITLFNLIDLLRKKNNGTLQKL